MPTATAVRALIRLSRLKFLIGGFFSYALGAAVARFDGATIDWIAYVHGQLMVSAFHLMAHYLNDYYDRFCDAECERTPWSGGSGALLADGLSPSVALVAGMICAAIGVLCAIGFVVEGKPGPAVAGAAAGFLAWSYSAPPLRLLARGWGELGTALIIAVLFPLAGYLTFATEPARLLVSTLPSFAAMLVLMFGVEFPDVEADRRTGKLNLVARLGRARGRILVYAAVGAIYAGTAIALAFGASPALAAFVLLTVPIAWGLCAQLARSDFSQPAVSADVAGRSVALLVSTILGSMLAYLCVI